MLPTAPTLMAEKERQDLGTEGTSAAFSHHLLVLAALRDIVVRAGYARRDHSFNVAAGTALLEQQTPEQQAESEQVTYKS